MKKKNLWSITPVLTGKFGMVRDDIKYMGGNPCINSFVPSVLFLLESQGNQVVVDTGFGDAEECAEKLKLIVKRDRPYLELLKEYGVKPDKVNGIIFTHLHWDHAGSSEYFPNAFFYCQKKEWERVMLYPEEYPVEWTYYLKKNKERVRIISKEESVILPGLRVRYVGGHTFGSQIVLVDTINGLEIISGDVMMTEKNLQENIPVGLCVNQEECKNALNIIKEYEAVKIYPSHDFGIFGKE